VLACQAPAGAVATADDCDDQRADVAPGLPEVCDGVDNDGDGDADGAGAVDALTFYADGDGDGFGTTAVLACAQPADAALVDGDCNDGDVLVFPGADERCNGADDDCDGGIDEGATAAATWYQDRDGDTVGDSARTLFTCTPPADYVATSGDCNDV
jgi:hypothetical protein